jgi:hypothetical protein
MDNRPMEHENSSDLNGPFDNIDYQVPEYKNITPKQYANYYADHKARYVSRAKSKKPIDSTEGMDSLGPSFRKRGFSLGFDGESGVYSGLPYSYVMEIPKDSIADVTTVNDGFNYDEYNPNDEQLVTPEHMREDLSNKMHDAKSNLYGSIPGSGIAAPMR